MIFQKITELHRKFGSSKRAKTAVFLGLSALLANAIMVGSTPAFSAPDASQQSPYQVDGPAPLPIAPPNAKVTQTHTDMVALYLDNGKLAMAGTADYDVNGDGKVSVNEKELRVDPATTYFYVNDNGKTTVTNENHKVYRFLDVGTEIWVAPQVQQDGLIWPGLASEDKSLEGAFEGGDLTFDKDKSDGPGDMYVFTISSAGYNAIFSSKSGGSKHLDFLSHVHMNWVFTKPGIYHLHFTFKGKVNGAEQTVSNVYTMIVGGDKPDAGAEQNIPVTVSGTAEKTTLNQNDKAVLNYQISPQNASGYVEVTDQKTGKVLGHTWAANGKARFVATNLSPGKHLFAAHFVPLIDNSYSSAVGVTVGNGVSPAQPQNTPATAQNEPNPTDDAFFANSHQTQSNTAPQAAPAPAPAQTGDKCVPETVLDHGHMDMFAVYAGGGKAAIRFLEDVTGFHVLRDPETVLIRVNESAKSELGSMPGGPAGYVLPLTQENSLPWPGWETKGTAASGYSDTKINITGVDGPGTVYLYKTDSFGEAKTLLDNGSYALPGTIHEQEPSHTHAKWVFSEAGVYKLTVNARVTNPHTGDSILTPTYTYAIQVGNVPLGDSLCGLQAHDQDTAAKVQEEQKKAEVRLGEEEQQQDAQDANTQQAGKKAIQQSVETQVFSSPWFIAGLVVGGILLLLLGGVLGLLGYRLFLLKE